MLFLRRCFGGANRKKTQVAFTDPENGEIETSEVANPENEEEIEEKKEEVAPTVEPVVLENSDSEGDQIEVVKTKEQHWAVKLFSNKSPADMTQFDEEGFDERIRFKFPARHQRELCNKFFIALIQ